MSDRSIQKFKEYVQKLNPIDDIIFRKMAENKEFCEEILRIFLQDYQLKVLNNKSQYAITNTWLPSFLSKPSTLGIQEHAVLKKIVDFSFG